MIQDKPKQTDTNEPKPKLATMQTKNAPDCLTINNDSVKELVPNTRTIDLKI